ncbi:DinB family protein [Streptomyces sp. ISL-11]|uniref:DinB family protein n=1 Tax=Streptomyces sp. ISL-11 TaxID=2819174 RepID=UPI001BE97DC1|nr:DinB family protein [Streptomyces sp. ISL-11]MBT2387284.1 DinB family protein [Streptomyces sp. ISL-11]
MTNSQRPGPPTDCDERTSLEGWLDFHRETLARKCEGLTDEQLREASVPPSELTLLGLVRHLAECERGWFGNVLAGDEKAAEPIYFTDEDPDGEFHLSERDTWEEAYATWQAQIAAAREATRGRSLDDLGVGEHRSGETFNLRWIYTHMIEEYARHNGHADLIRERIDGATEM